MNRNWLAEIFNLIDTCFNYRGGGYGTKSGGVKAKWGPRAGGGAPANREEFLERGKTNKSIQEMSGPELRLAKKRNDREFDNTKEEFLSATQFADGLGSIRGRAAKSGQEQKARDLAAKLEKLDDKGRNLRDEIERRSPKLDDASISKFIARRREREQKRNTAAEIRKIRKAENDRRIARKGQPVDRALDIVKEQDVRDQLRRRLSYALKDGPISRDKAMASIQGVARSEPYRKRVIRRLGKSGALTPEVDRRSIQSEFSKVLAGPIKGRESAIKDIAKKYGLPENEVFSQYKKIRDDAAIARRKARAS